MNVHILMPMPDEAFLRKWEQGITRVVGRSSWFEVRDPAFRDREPNPVVEIRTEDGDILWSDDGSIPDPPQGARPYDAFIQPEWLERATRS